MSKHRKKKRKKHKSRRPRKTLLLVGFPAEAVSTVQAQLGRFG